MNKGQEFFINASLEGLEEQYDQLDDVLQDIYNKYSKDRKKLLQELGNVLLEYKIKDDKLILSLVEQDKLNKKIDKLISEMVETEISLTNDITENVLKAGVENTYNYTGYLYSLGISFELQVLSDKEIKRIISEKVKSEIWSKRLWKNKKVLEADLKSLFEQCYKGNISVNDISRLIRDKYNQDFYNAKRLINTEFARCSQGAYDQFAKNNDVEYFIFSATLDKKTSKICRDYDGLVSAFNDKTRPIPPLHPNCRSASVVLPHKDYRPKTRRDNETKEIIPYLTYKEWAKKQGIRT